MNIFKVISAIGLMIFLFLNWNLALGEESCQTQLSYLGQQADLLYRYTEEKATLETKKATLEREIKTLDDKIRGQTKATKEQIHTYAEVCKSPLPPVPTKKTT